MISHRFTSFGHHRNKRGPFDLPLATAPRMTASSLRISSFTIISLTGNVGVAVLDSRRPAAVSRICSTMLKSLIRMVGTPSASDQIQLRLFLVARAPDTAYKATVPSSCTRANFLPTFPIRLFLTSFNSVKNWSFDRVTPSANFALTAMMAD